MELTNNILYSIMEFNKSLNIKQKISWLLTAISFLEAYVRAENYKKEVEEMKVKVKEIAGSINWDIYESYRMGRFELISNKEYEKVLEKLLELEEVRNRLIKLMQEVGLSDGQFGMLKTPELRQRN